mmetsp:Transcript_48030/g.159187  ORF Transcript_48030/g.159187 Transcript_48030/m.159187 type:complete len:220 (-) Transcript_48030:3026-3685(-)
MDGGRHSQGRGGVRGGDSQPGGGVCSAASARGGSAECSRGCDSSGGASSARNLARRRVLGRRGNAAGGWAAWPPAGPSAPAPGEQCGAATEADRVAGTHHAAGSHPASRGRERRCRRRRRVAAAAGPRVARRPGPVEGAGEPRAGGAAAGTRAERALHLADEPAPRRAPPSERGVRLHEVACRGAASAAASAVAARAELGQRDQYGAHGRSCAVGRAGS